MTVCIAAICCDKAGTKGRSVVVASDRMVTMRGFVEFEHEVSKTQKIDDHMLGMMAGDALNGAKLIEQIKAQVQPAMTTIDERAQLATGVYRTLRLQTADAVFCSVRGFNVTNFYHEGLQQRIIPQIAGQIDAQVSQFDLGVEILLAGVDDGGGQVFTLGNPGILNDMKQIGYAAIGSGAIHATQSLIAYRHHPGKPLLQTVYSVYASKIKAEIAPGVGKDTDMAIIHEDGIHFLTADHLNELETLYNETETPLEKTLESKVAKLKLDP